VSLSVSTRRNFVPNNEYAIVYVVLVSSSTASSHPAAEAGPYRRLDAAWAPAGDVACGCPVLTPGGTYLLAGRRRGRAGHGHLLLGAESVAMPWRSTFGRRLKRLARFQLRRRC